MDFLLQLGQSENTLQQIPYEVWVIIFSYMDSSPNKIVEFCRCNKMFNQIGQMNLVWFHSYAQTFPVLLEEKREVEKFDRNKFDWKSEIKKNYLLLTAFKHIVTAMNDSKETGNEHFKKAEYEEAINYYKQSLRLAK